MSAGSTTVPSGEVPPAGGPAVAGARDRPAPSARRAFVRPALARARGHVARPHRLWAEAAAMCLLYALYDSGRGLAVSEAPEAIGHARAVARLERALHVYVEPQLQRALSHPHWLTTVFGVGYASFHLGVTGLVLLWLYRRHPRHFPRVRSLVVVTSLLALAGFTFFPVAPPRLAGVGIHDTLHLARAGTESGLLAWLYNPYAAMPSLHMAYAVIAGGSIAVFAARRAVRVVGAAYPLYTAVEVVATGNHFLLDIVTGTLVVGMALVLVVPLTPAAPGRRAEPPVPLADDRELVGSARRGAA